MLNNNTSIRQNKTINFQTKPVQDSMDGSGLQATESVGSLQGGVKWIRLT